MSDFTKDELENMWNCVDLYINDVDHPYQHLLDKLQSMIDNYCDHECPGDGQCLANICDRCARMT